jgi:broad specificity phosphatase PhoE
MLVKYVHMFLLIMRHGESIDDLTDQYGGWGDFPLTSNGKLQIHKTADKIKNLQIKFDHIYYSPLKRASQSALIISNQLKLGLEEFLYLKERNSYGLLTGMNKSEAHQRYPELVEAFQQGKGIGITSEENFLNQIDLGLDLLIQKHYQENLILITHGGFIKNIFNHYLHKDYYKTGDGGFVLIEVDNNKKFTLVQTSQIEWSDNN